MDKLIEVVVAIVLIGLTIAILGAVFGMFVASGIIKL